MSDISKCMGGDCPLKDTCYRYLAPTHPTYQSWLNSVPYDNGCDFYWEMKRGLPMSEEEEMSRFKKVLTDIFKL